MKPNNGPHRPLLGAGFGLLLAFGALPAAESSKSPPPVRIVTPAKEAELANLVLTAEAERRLGIATVRIERRQLARTRLFGGELVVPADAPGGTNGPRQSVFAILPALAPAELVRLAQSQIDADGQIEQARVQLESTKIALARAEQMLRDKAGIARVVDEARAQVSLAEAGLRTAQARRDLLGPAMLESANPARLWVRVPIYVGDFSRINTKADASVGSLAGGADGLRINAKPVAAPPSANPAAATVDLYYEVPNPERALRLGQRVGVFLRLNDDEDSLVVPVSAIVHDVQGGAWVYEKSGPQSYTRRRVQLRQVVGGQAAVAGGVKAGVEVVATGVAELFGTEFGAGK